MRHLVSWLFYFLDVIYKFCTYVLFKRNNKVVFFKETQWFTQWRIWLPQMILFFYSMSQFFLEHSSIQEIFVGSGLRMFWTVIIPLCIIILFSNVRLESVITAEDLYVKLFPLHLNLSLFAGRQFLQLIFGNTVH